MGHCQREYNRSLLDSIQSLNKALELPDHDRTGWLESGVSIVTIIIIIIIIISVSTCITKLPPWVNTDTRWSIVNRSVECISVTLTLKHYYKLKAKCTLVQALRLCTGRTAHRRSKGIALLIHDHDNRMGWGIRVTPRPLFTPGKTQYPLCRRLFGPQGRPGQMRKCRSPTGIRFPDRPARSQSLYRLSYRTHETLLQLLLNCLQLY